MNYKLICIDMDGTLLDDNHLISEENKKAIKEAHNRGVVIAVTTGRLFTSASYSYSLLDIEGPIIASNGTYIRERSKEEFIYKDTFTLEECNELNEILNKSNLTHYFYTHNTALGSETLPENHPYVAFNKEVSEDLRIHFCIKEDLSPLFKEYENEVLKAIVIEKKDKEALLKVKNELKSLDKFEVVSSGPYNFEIMKKGSSKGSAVQRLAESLGIKQEQVICMGDNENDLSMIRYAGLGIAMGNAVDLLKNEANYITDTNVNSGVGKAIRKFVLN
ncbi:Cof-type HAD-IIB family hydrolase [Clostridium vincentii]|uniref:Sugar phosphatase YidA n=1 Tax=Clostridium vincentii TaxID=52704 RepID=A0A2T0BGS4_9CLOT|nr:Cof-type HAD-IIB family hydrolase [Clostridium vincentii]PRR83065.1 Sugar phosphatase YidA [Clostridium vincentii]